MARKKQIENLSEDMIENIKSYGDKIETIEDYTAAVRQTIGYHIGSKGTKGHLVLIKEIIQNAIDEAVRPYSPCNFIRVIYDERTLTTSVEDNGRGIPFDSMLRVYTTAYTSTNYKKEKGDYSSGINGSGGKITLALSSYFKVESYILGEAKYLEAIEGKIDPKVIKDMENPGKQGTIVTFIPSAVLDNITTTCENVYDLFFGLFPLIPVGTTVEYVGIDKAGRVKFQETRVNRDGIIADLITKTQSPIIAPIKFGADTGITKAEIAFTYDATELESEDVSCFSNFCITIGGTHLTGFLDGLCQYFRSYMNKIFLGEKSKINVVNNDIKTGLKGIVNAAHLNPVFNGQAKEILNNEDMYPFVKNLTLRALEEWTKTNPGDLQKLCKFFKDVAETRMKSDDAKIKLTTKYQSSSLSGGKPKKYLAPSGKKELELVIVEGDSAMGAAKNSRDSDKQGIFPIRGKIPNAFSTEKNKFLSNAEIAAMIVLIGGGHGKNFDVNKVPWSKVITMADADPDGSHINSLLLRFFLIYMPDLIKAGKLYKAVPPLYGVPVRGKMHYFTNKIEFTKYVQSIFAKNNVLTTINDQPLTKIETIETFIRNIDYTYELEIVSNTYAIAPKLLEDILVKWCIENCNYAQFKKSIEKLYRFLEVTLINGIVVIKGLAFDKFHTVFINDRLLASCNKVLQIIKSNLYLMYKVNNEPVSLYQLMKIFEASQPSNVTRYKGLGEQDPKQLAVSALRPDGDRTLVRYTIDDVKQEIEIIRQLESNKIELFKDIKVTRQDIE